MRKELITLAAVTVGSFIPAVQAKDTFIEKLPVKPDTCYRLSFQAETRAKNATWLLRTSNRQGELPYDGCYERDWQQIVPGKTSYTHSFLTPTDTTCVWFGIRYEGQQPQVSEVKLEKLTPTALLINGDFAAGPDNYSGWTEHFNTVFLEQEGKPALKIEHNGYALTDRVPVLGGGAAQGKTTSRHCAPLCGLSDQR